MCVCVKPRTPQPANRGECDGDVEIFVGDPAWRYTAERSILAAASPTFNAQFYGPLATKDEVLHIPDVDPRAFGVLLRFVAGQPLELISAATALRTLYAAHKYLMPELVSLCVQFLCDSLEIDSVLEVYCYARCYSSQFVEVPGAPDRLPSAPPETDEPPPPPEVMSWWAVLLTRCFKFIDENAEKVLIQECVEDLSRDALADVIQRDSLNCHELTVFNAVQRWGDRECRRQSLTPSPTTIRATLGELIFFVRLPLLTADEFLQEPLLSELLTKDETKYLSAVITGRGKIGQAPSPMKLYLKSMMTRRCQAKVTSVEKPPPRKLWRRKKRKKEKEKDEDKPDKGCCECMPKKETFCDVLVDILIMCFD